MTLDAFSFLLGGFFCTLALGVVIWLADRQVDRAIGWIYRWWDERRWRRSRGLPAASQRAIDRARRANRLDVPRPRPDAAKRQRLEIVREERGEP